MDDSLRRASAARVRDRIARAWLDAPPAATSLGSIILSPHQVDAASRLDSIVEEFGGALLADAVGTGKTYTALAVARAARAVTIVAPAALRARWADALGRVQRTARFVSFEALSRATDIGLDRSDFMIVDEAHHARNPRTRRYDALARLAAGARVLLLSATPIHNRPRELRSQLALFLGSRAYTLGDAELARLIVRREHRTLQEEHHLPAVAPTTWLPVPANPTVLRAILELPSSVASADGGTADALLRLGLVRVWMSSDAALRAALRRRSRGGTALTQSLLSGRLPTRRELSAWVLVDDAVQLAFPELVSAPHHGREEGLLLEAITAHLAGVRRVLHALAEHPGSDAARAAHVQRLRERHIGARVVVFTQFVQTALSLFALLRPSGGVAVVTADGARIASGKVSRSDVVRRFGVRDDHSFDRRIPLDVLICTDVLSEGLDLQGASVLVHLDLPWTPARLEQRVGRLRRMGSPHARVYVYGIGPPTTRRELLPVIRALQRKARVVRAVAGESELLAHEPVFRHRRTSDQRASARTDITTHGEALRGLFARWLHQDDATSPDRDVRDCGYPTVALAKAHIDASWLGLALVRRRGRHRVVALCPSGASEHPFTVSAVARVATNAADVVGENGDAASLDSEPRFRAAFAILDGWLAAQRGSAFASPVVDAPSPDHARVLRRLAELQSGVPRHQRPTFSDLATRCRDLVLAARGAGAERALTEWHTADDETPRRGADHADERLKSLEAMLAGLGLTTIPPDAGTDISLVALLVVTST